MIADMTFECMLVSRDVRILSLMVRLLDGLSIHTQVSMTITRALELLPRTTADLVIIDCDESDAHVDFFQEIWSTGKHKKPTIMAISSTGRSIPGAHVIVTKPLTYESGLRYIKIAYERMVHEYRRHARHVVMIPIHARDEQDRVTRGTVTDIGQRGVGLQLKDVVEVDQTLSFDLPLPGGSRAIHIESRVLWTRRYAEGSDPVAGCEFLRIPPVDSEILRDWLNARCKLNIKAHPLEIC